MNPKLIGCMFFSMAAGGVCAGLALWSGGGVLVALGVYSLAGSATLVPAALWAAAEPRARRGSAPAKAGTAVA